MEALEVHESTMNDGMESASGRPRPRAARQDGGDGAWGVCHGPMGDGDGGGEGCLSVEVWVVIEITGHTPDQAGRGDP
jgi:hypothetical protein